MVKHSIILLKLWHVHQVFTLIILSLRKNKNLLYSGCINGGAQIRPPSGTTNRELTSTLEELYKKLPQSVPENTETKNVYTNFFDGQHTDKAKMLLHTNYHVVEKMKNKLNIKW